MHYLNAVGAQIEELEVTKLAKSSDGNGGQEVERKVQLHQVFQVWKITNNMSDWITYKEKIVPNNSFLTFKTFIPSEARRSGVAEGTGVDRKYEYEIFGQKIGQKSWKVANAHVFVPN